MKIFVLVILGLYLAVVAFSAVLGSLGAKIITKRNLLLTLFGVVVTIAFTYIYFRQGVSSAIYGVAGGLFGISGLALSNAANMGQRPNLKHHFIRLAFDLVLLVVMYLVYRQG
ncbi:hypothetical protein SAG0136_04905 [Streptococcus agalactiae LMG 14747]|uniref:Permease n=2 Tax=Streptococcus TaxID=1301 RepID=V6Z1G6_STRAG|nr:hypothetical protein [Streptococcus acidominimus]ESV54588.1 hypothetical protein SAG0136_04905 [Streptococcus agalactiae LMG 14747]SNV32230.1 Uncharacterised protein [Streptococcus acidominimus]